MDALELLLKNKKVNFEKLEPYGFHKENSGFIYTTSFDEENFKMTVVINGEGHVSASIIDLETDEPYVLHLVSAAKGSFVGKIREKYSTVLSSIAESCFELDVFRSIKAIKILKYAQENFAEYPEFLWKRYPEYAVLRRKDTGKWYGLLMRIKKDKLKLKEQGPLEILVIRSNPADVDRIIDGKKYFPAYHMNKKNWLTVSLESSVPDKQILAMLLASRGLANK